MAYNDLSLSDVGQAIVGSVRWCSAPTCTLPNIASAQVYKGSVDEPAESRMEPLISTPVSTSLCDASAEEGTPIPEIWESFFVFPCYNSTREIVY